MCVTKGETGQGGSNRCVVVVAGCRLRQRPVALASGGHLLGDRKRDRGEGEQVQGLGQAAMEGKRGKFGRHI